MLSYAINRQVSPEEVKDNLATSSPVESPKSTAVNIITGSPTMKPTQERALPPTVSPTKYCESPVTDPICPFLVENKCCQPMCTWDSAVGRCSFIDGNNNNEREWVGEFEVAQTHVVKAVNEKRHAPKVIAHREAELLFTPGISSERRLDLHEKSSLSDQLTLERIESVGTVYLVKEGGDTPILDASVQRLVDGSNTVFSLSNDYSDIDIIVDLNSLRLVGEVSLILHGDTELESAKLGLHYDDGRNQEEGERFHMPNGGWEWLDFPTSQSASGKGGTISISFPRRQARYVMIRMVGGRSESSQSWGFSNIEIRGGMDGLSLDGDDVTVRPMVRAIDTTSRSFTPSGSASVFVSVYSPSGKLIGTMKARDPSKQRGILERHLSVSQIPDYSESIWSVTLPFNWVDEGNIILIGCVDPSRPKELLVHRLEFTNLAQFSEHTITR